MWGSWSGPASGILQNIPISDGWIESMSSSKSIWSRIFGLNSIFSRRAPQLSGVGVAQHSVTAAPDNTGDGSDASGEAALDEVPRDIGTVFRGVKRVNVNSNGPGFLPPVAVAAASVHIEATEDGAAAASYDISVREADALAVSSVSEQDAALKEPTAEFTANEPASEQSPADEEPSSTMFENDAMIAAAPVSASLADRLSEVALLNKRKAPTSQRPAVMRSTKYRQAPAKHVTANRKKGRVLSTTPTWPVYMGRVRSLAKTPSIGSNGTSAGGALIVPLAPKAMPRKTASVAGNRGLRRAA